MAPMELTLWAKTNGTLVNVLTVLLGSGLGVLIRGRLPARDRENHLR